MKEHPHIPRPLLESSIVYDITKKVITDYRNGEISADELGEVERWESQELFETTTNKYIPRSRRQESFDNKKLDANDQLELKRIARDEIKKNYVLGVPGGKEAFIEMVRQETEEFQRANGLEPRKKK